MCFAIALYVGTYHLALYFKPPKEKTNLSFALLCYAMAAYDFFAAGLYRTSSCADGAFWQKGEMISVALIVIFLLLFASDIVQIPLSRALRITIGSIAVLAIVNHFTPLGVNANVPEPKEVEWLGITYHECQLGIGVSALYVFILVAMVYSLRRLWKYYRQGNTYLRPIVFAMAFFFVTAANDMAVGMGIYYSIYLIEYGFFIVLFAMAQSLQTKLVRLYTHTEETKDQQSNIIDTIQKIQPQIQAVVSELSEVSQRVASQAAEHAATAEEVGATIASVKGTTDETADAASETRSIAERTRESAVLGTERLRSVEQGFLEAMPTLEQLETDMGGLAQQISSTEEILGFIRQIAQQINILAINAGIQAAKAGKYGTGFRVVAREMRSMIGTTDEYLERSRKLLESIRAQARESSTNTRQSSRLLGKQVEELRSAGTVVAKITDAFTETSRRVDIIAGASQKQHAGINEVAVAIEQLKLAASDLNQSANTVISSVGKLVKTRESLDEVLNDESES